MMIQQLSIFLENRAGQLSEVTELLAQNHIDMLALNIAETSDYGVLRLIVDDAQRASAVLLERGFILTMTPVVGVAVPDRPGGLGQVLSVISQAGIDVEYMYSIFGQKDGEAFMIFRVADTEGLTELFEANKIHRIKGEDLGIH